MAKTAGIDLETAAMVHAAYWKKNWAIKKIASVQITKVVNDQMWLYNPVSQLWYSLRFEKDIFSTLVQGTASYVFDRWVEFILEVREQLTGQMHDEFILCIREGFEDQCTALVEEAMTKLNEELKLNRELACGIAYGKKYSDIH